MFEPDSHCIGSYTQDIPGPLLICTAAIHGNEPAGVIALQRLFRRLAAEPRRNPRFHFRGKLLGLLGNVRAYQAQTRFLHEDLNRIWLPERVAHIEHTLTDQLQPEELELAELLHLMRREMHQVPEDQDVILLDIHTTTARGGIFSVATSEPGSVRLGTAFHAPVIKGFMELLRGTTLHYFRREHTGKSTRAITFEAGQHQDPKSTRRAMAAIINCLRSVGCVDPRQVESQHDTLLRRYAHGLPRVAELVHRHVIQPEDAFRMLPGYENFQAVRQGEKLAEDRHGPILAPCDALILMPLYQKQGDDGFFLIRPVGN